MDIPLQLAAMTGLAVVFIIVAKLWQYYFIDLPKKRRHDELIETMNSICEASLEKTP